MNDNLNDWLNSLGIDTENTPTQQQESSQQGNLEVAHISEVSEEVTSEPAITMEPLAVEAENFTPQDAAELLTAIGVTDPPEDAQAEEIHDNELEVSESTEESDDTSEESEDLSDREETNESEGVESNVSQENTTPSTNADTPLIPENSPTLTMDTSTSRFSGAEWYKEIQVKEVLFAGIGGIGSWSCLLLGRMALKALYLFDDDAVDGTNMSGQLFSLRQIGDNKVDAMSDLLRQYTSTYNVYAYPRRYSADDFRSDVMICGFDNMEARKLFFNSWVEHVDSLDADESLQRKCLFIDGRLDFDTLQVFCIQGTDREAMERYREKYLFSDEEAESTICSMKQTSYLAAMIGSVITNLFTNWVANSLDPIIPYDVPFFTEYNAQHMIFKTEH